MAEAIWNGATLAKTNTIAHVEGNIYFPIDAVNWDYLRPNRDVPVTFCVSIAADDASDPNFP